MKYICRFIADHPNANCSVYDGIVNSCKHSKPHEWVEETIDFCVPVSANCFNRRGGIETECDCVLVGLEYYMKEIIKKHEESEK